MKINTLVKDSIAEYLDEDNNDAVRTDLKLSKILTLEELRSLVHELAEEICVDIPDAHIPHLKTVGDLVHILCVVAASDEYDECDDSDPPVIWRGKAVNLRTPIYCDGQKLMIFEVIEDPIHGRILVTYHGFFKRYAYSDTCAFITDQALVDYLDNNYGRPVRQRGIIY